MKYIYKELRYQKDAVKAVVDVFKGQPYQDKVSYIRDLGHLENPELNYEDDTGFNNANINLNSDELLNNIKSIQSLNNIQESSELIKKMGHCHLDIEMETGTGKTFVYTKTMFELNKLYGWTKFIIVVPSIAIREGVFQSIIDTADYFQVQYGKKIAPFIYQSSNLTKLDDFSKSADMQVMIINTQAFNTSLKEDGKNKEARIIFSERDEFASRRPIDVIAANRPIIIMDEPQKMGGTATQNALKKFNPLFLLNYSATHTEHHNLVYRLDALDAYNEKLVKKIEVKGFQVNNLPGINSYLYLNKIFVDKEGPKAVIEFEQKQKTSTTPKRITINMDSKNKSNIFALSGNLEEYKGYEISEVDAFNNKVIFSNGVEIYPGQIQGADKEDEYLRRIQIRETIKSHFEKEKKNFKRGIKTLSLFFIDEVAKYRQYDDDGNELLGEYGKIFEEEYKNILSEVKELFDDPDYTKYLNDMCSNVSEVHRGYFSIDKKTHRAKDSKKESEDDISAYDEIIKNKQYLMSFESKTRFIFSHSALREGWDNPNVFQICTLKHSDNTTTKRQEIGRGLRLCVDKNLVRQDIQSCGDKIHDINVLTVIASESYNNFANDLQKEIEETLGNRPTIVSANYFVGKLINDNGEKRAITEKEANLIYQYMARSNYIDFDNKITPEYHEAVANETLQPMPSQLESYSDDIHKYIKSIYDPSIIKELITDGNKSKIIHNRLNDNFDKFKGLWDKINHKYSYTVNFDSNELIKNSILEINNSLYVSKLTYKLTVGIQKENIEESDVKSRNAFKVTVSDSNSEKLNIDPHSSIKYDLIGKIAQGATITRKTAAAILKGILYEKFEMFKFNPEEFMAKVIEIIKEQKSSLVVSHIEYNEIEGSYNAAEVFTTEKIDFNSDKTFKANKAIIDYISTDGSGANSVEMNFAKELDINKKVCTYAKIPKGGYVIPTPVGNYSPDWAIVFEKDSVKHIFFVAETKGSMSSLQLREIEKNKISCAEKLFNEMFKDKEVVYHKVTNFDDLINQADSN